MELDQVSGVPQQIGPIWKRQQLAYTSEKMLFGKWFLIVSGYVRYPIDKADIRGESTVETVA